MKAIHALACRAHHFARHVAPRLALCALLATPLTACVNEPQRLGRSDQQCCTATRADFTSYRLDIQEMPGFLKPYVEDALRASMNETGLGESQDAVLVARVTFDQLEEEPPGHADDFEGHLEAGGGASFTARLTLRLIDTRTNTEVMRGALSRHHHVAPGDYMHDGRARLSMYEGFSDLLRKFAGK